MTLPMPKRRRFRKFNEAELVFLEHGLNGMPPNENIAGMIEEVRDEIAMRDRFKACGTHDLEPLVVGGGTNMWQCRKCGAPGFTDEDLNRAMFGSGY